MKYLWFSSLPSKITQFLNSALLLPLTLSPLHGYLGACTMLLNGKGPGFRII